MTKLTAYVAAVVEALKAGEHVATLNADDREIVELDFWCDIPVAKSASQLSMARATNYGAWNN